MARAAFRCGPLEIDFRADDGRLEQRAREALAIYATPFTGPRLGVLVDAAAGPRHDGWAVGGNYLTCARLRVDRVASGLRAQCPSGASATYDGAARAWHMAVPPEAPLALEDLEELLSLVLTRGWRDAGWIPLHAAGLARGDASVLLCAASGVGKSTLSAALVRRGWATLGDDKLLLSHAGGAPEVVGLTPSFNLDPSLAAWFPELSQLGARKPHSVWTDKRRIAVEEVWPGRLVARAAPTHAIRLTRGDRAGEVRVRRLAPEAVLSLLLHQTVVPSDRAEAARILAGIARAAARVTGFEVELGAGAFREAGCLDLVEEALGA